jgi:hypothetical protein
MAVGPAASKRAVGPARFELPWRPVSFVLDKGLPSLDGRASGGVQPPSVWNLRNRSQTPLVGQVDFVSVEV